MAFLSFLFAIVLRAHFVRIHRQNNTNQSILDSLGGLLNRSHFSSFIRLTNKFTALTIIFICNLSLPFVFDIKGRPCFNIVSIRFNQNVLNRGPHFWRFPYMSQESSNPGSDLRTSQHDRQVRVVGNDYKKPNATRLEAIGLRLPPPPGL